MDLGREWTAEDSPTSSPKREDRRMAQYFEEQGGLLFTQVNVTFRVESSVGRYLDGLRIIDPPFNQGEMYSYGVENREVVWDLLRNHQVELVEVHNWGLDVFGDCLGKAAIVEREFNPPEVKRTVIVADGQPDDPAVEQVYDEFGVNWVVINV